jgi:chaperonin GroEL (HSP60 family)
VLLESADGHVSCCNSGTQILSSLSLSHPVGSVIAKSVSNYHKSVGDGSKKMLIILKGIMEELNPSLDQLHKIEVSRAFDWVTQTAVPDLFMQLRKNKLLCRKLDSSTDFHSMLMQVASTSYRHRYGKEISRKLEEIVSALLHPSTNSDDATAHSIEKVY